MWDSCLQRRVADYLSTLSFLSSLAEYFLKTGQGQSLHAFPHVRHFPPSFKLQHPLSRAQQLPGWTCPPIHPSALPVTLRLGAALTVC